MFIYELNLATSHLYQIENKSTGGCIRNPSTNLSALNLRLRFSCACDKNTTSDAECFRVKTFLNNRFMNCHVSSISRIDRLVDFKKEEFQFYKVP